MSTPDGGKLKDVTFNRLPSVINNARSRMPDEETVDFFLSAIEVPSKMAGLIFSDNRHRLH